MTLDLYPLETSNSFLTPCRTSVTTVSNIVTWSSGRQNQSCQTCSPSNSDWTKCDVKRSCDCNNRYEKRSCIDIYYIYGISMVISNYIYISLVTATIWKRELHQGFTVKKPNAVRISGTERDCLIHASTGETFFLMIEALWWTKLGVPGSQTTSELCLTVQVVRCVM